VDGIPARALNDLGAQIPLVSTEIFGERSLEPLGNITVQGVLGEPVSAPLISVDIQIADEGDMNNIRSEMPIVAAVVAMNISDYDVILPDEVVTELMSLSVLPTPPVSVKGVVGDTGDHVAESVSVGTVDEVQESDSVVNAGNCDDNDESTDECVSEMNKLISEQKDDESLKLCWAKAKEKKGNFVVSRGILCHQDKVEGLSVSQLCVPKGRRPQILSLAHDSIFGGHLGERKTLERIRL